MGAEVREEVGRGGAAPGEAGDGAKDPVVVD